MKSTARHVLGLVSVSLAVSLGILGGCQTTGYVPVTSGTSGEGRVQGWSAVNFRTADDRKAVILHYGDRDRLTELVQAGADIWSVDIKGRKAQGTVNAAQATLAQRLGMRAELMPQSETQLKADSGYRNYEQIANRMRALAAKGQGFAQLVDIGDSWEKTQGKANRDIWALKLGKGTGKPVVTFVGCHHAREIVTPEMVLRMAEHLVENYGKDADVTAAIDQREIWLVPLVNPDGHTHALQGADWRKNANNQSGGKRRVGIDLNRNYATAWGTVGDSGNPESDVFRGTSAFSEPESQAIRDLVTKRPPVIYLTFHSYANTVMWAWDHKKTPPPDAPRLAALGKAMGKLSGYDAYQGAEMYLNGGGDTDWVYDNFKSLTYTVEVGSWNDGFMPPSSRLPKFFDENRAMMMYALKVADNPDAVQGPGVQATPGRGGVTVSAPGARAIEYFVNQPGQPGKGRQVMLEGGQALIAAESTARQLIYVHAQGPDGAWGPWQHVWSH